MEGISGDNHLGPRRLCYKAGNS